MVPILMTAAVTALGLATSWCCHVIDLHAGTLLQRVKTGEAVDTAIDAHSRFYYVSVQEVGDIAAFSSAKNVAADPATHEVWTTYTDGKRSFAQSWRQAGH